MDHKEATDDPNSDLLTGKSLLTNSCRVCMSESTNMSNIFEEESNIVNRIEFCTGLIILQQEGLSALICESCLSDLNIAHMFKTKCLQAYEKLQQLVLKVKQETEDSKYYNMYSDDDVKVEINFSYKCEDTAEDVESKPSVRKKTETPEKSKEVRQFPCQVCQEIFQTNRQRDAHNRRLHKDIVETFICEVCGKMFVHRASLLSHTRSHLPPQFACTTCDYVTWHKHDLNKHLRIHQGIKHYQCEYCTASYYTSSNLQSHIRRFHQRLKPYSCSRY